MRVGAWATSAFIFLTTMLGSVPTVSAQELTVTWDPSTDTSVVGYVVYVGTQPGEYSATFDVGGVTSFVYGVVPEQPYYFAVASYTAEPLIGARSAEVVGSAPAAVPPPGDFYPPADGSSGNAPPAADVTEPLVTITTPTRLRISGSAPFVTVGGTAIDDSGVTQVTWTNNRGENGFASGTDVWVADVVLHAGRNDITITAFDGAGNRGTATISIQRQTWGQ
jgi:hypothetical protein